ncbi:fumarylacetoacetate hydrolase family protein [Frankia sp. R82]|uniref:fumarylacetoacetate hydrolase family protein n=1 Tax=Frankia sp. R82 TaxID=2950553 RepID=UPI0020445B12|nr:fumarylacetoacetate hydrolase family protein [Frankia sp. R82]MCM3883199.1 fumarylacetoacetate hydrolase family protein [Frankia sp. R82]
MRFTGVREGRRVLVGLMLEAVTPDPESASTGSRAPAAGAATAGGRVALLAEVDDFYADLATWSRTARRIVAAQGYPSQSQRPISDPLAADAPQKTTDGVRTATDDVRAAAAEMRTMSEVDLVPAARAGARVLGMGLNYHDHAVETGLAVPKYPPLFARWTASLCVDGTPVPVPPGERGLDWEGELAVVVGAPLTDVDEATAAASVFGYAVFNDLSARRAQGSSAQWTLGKNADRSGPIGPVVTADEVGDPGAGLRLVTTVNGEIVQDGNTSNMIFSIGQILSFVSRTLTLNPGDILITGTPAGVGYTRTPPRYLHPGDTVEVTIDRLGTIRTPVVDSTHRP